MHYISQQTLSIQYLFRAFLVETMKSGKTEYFGLWWNGSTFCVYDVDDDDDDDRKDI